MTKGVICLVKFTREILTITGYVPGENENFQQCNKADISGN